MVQASKKTGSVLYFEPLRLELNDCFGALKDVSPDMVFSNRKGLNIQGGCGDSSSDKNDETVGEQSTSTSDSDSANSTKKKAQSKCHVFIF